MEETRAIIEAIIFASESPLTVDKIREVLHEFDRSEISRLVQDLINEYEKRRGGFLLQEDCRHFERVGRVGHRVAGSL